MKKWILYIMVFLSVTACVSENTINIDPNPPFPVEDEPGKVTLQIVFPKMNSGTLWTRAFTDGEEKKIDSMEVFVFENTSSSHAMTDTYLYRVSVPKDSIHALSNDTTYRAVVTLKTRPLTGQRLICVANIPHGLNLSLTEGTSTVTDLVAQLKFSGTPWHTAPTSASDGIPMWGQMNETLTFTPQGHLETGKTVPLITMIRAMAKIEVGVDVNGTGDPALGFGHIFTLDSVFLCRASDSGYIAPHKDFIDKAVVTKTNPVDRDGRMSVAGYSYKLNVTPPDRILDNTIYVPETDSLITTPSVIEPAFLVIKAKYYDGNEYYYRIDFTQNDEYKPLLRNHSYLVDILNIRMPGYGTLAEAMNAPPASTNYAVTIAGAGTLVSEEIMDIVVYKNEYMLGVNTGEVMFDWTDDWLGKPAGGTTYYQLMFYTDCESGWKATVSSGNSWLSINGATSGPKVSAPALAANLNILAASNNTGEERTGIITLTAGLLTKEIKVRQSGGANSIIVKAGTPLRIPLEFARKARTALGLSSAITGGVPSVAWYININSFSPTISSDNIVTSAGLVLNTQQWGNALVVLANGADTLWSWHVWVVNDENTNASYHSLNTKPVFMDRLLGGPSGSFTTPGQPYYQWGRKDPFLPGKYGVVQSTPSTDMVMSVQHPGTFYAGLSPYHNWVGTGYNNNLWNAPDGKKTYSDPCPTGWRVPYYQGTLTPWRNETSTTVGNFRNTGYISQLGVWANSPSEGYIWTAFPNGFHANYAYINASGVVNPSASTDGYRGRGYAIRCVKDISRKY